MTSDTKLNLMRIAAELTIASLQKHPNGVPVTDEHRHPRTAAEIFDAWVEKVCSTYEGLDQPPK